MNLSNAVYAAKWGAIIAREGWGYPDTARWDADRLCLAYTKGGCHVSLSIEDALATDWFIKEAVEEEGPPDGPTIVGLKFLQKGFGSISGQNYLESFEAGRVTYPADEWVKVEGNGCYLGMKAPRASCDSLFSGGVGPVLAFFEARVGTLVSSPAGVQTYRWVRRLTGPCPERLDPKFREWLRTVEHDDFTDEHRAFATGTIAPVPEPAIEEWLLELDGGRIYFASPKGGHWGPSTVRATVGFIDFDIELPNGIHIYDPIYFRGWWNKMEELWSRTYAPDMGYTQEVIARAARVLKRGEER